MLQKRPGQGELLDTRSVQPKKAPSLPQPLSACSSVFSNSSEKIMNLSKNAVRKNDTKRPNAYANFFSKKEKAKSESQNEEPDDEDGKK